MGRSPFSPQKGEAPLYAAAAEGHLQVVELLVAEGADQGAPDGDGDTPLYAAAARGHDEAARALVEAGADIPAKCRVSECRM